MKERTLDEHLAADGLESFVASQFFPDNINVLVGRKSQFVYDFNSYYFKRKGRTTEKQKKLKDILYKTAHFEKGGATRSFTEIINTLCTLWSRSSLEQLTLDTDENPIYQNCLKSNKQLKEIIQKRGFVHRLTNSKEERNFQNKLFPVNYIDRQIRKDLAEHVRETVQFSRNMNNCMERFNLYIFWHNYLKPYRINGNKMKNLSHAEVSGIPKETRGKIVESVFSLMGTRFKEVRMHLTPFQERCWIRSNPTPV